MLIATAALAREIPVSMYHIALPKSRLDLEFHAALTQAMASWWAQGAMYLPRWTPTLYQGLGSPAFVHYPPLFHLVAGAAVNWIGITAEQAMRAVDGLGAWVMGVVWFTSLRSLAVSRGVALACGAAAVWNPFALFLTTYISALPWSFSFASASTVLAATALPSVSPKRVAVIVIGAALLSFTHVLMTFMVLLTCFAMGCGTLMFERSDLRTRVREIVLKGAAVVSGVGIASIHLLPAILLRKYSNESGYAADVDWRRAFALQIPFADASWPLVNYGLSGLLIGCLVVAWFLHARRQVSNPHPAEVTRARLITAGMGAAVISTQLTYPVWAVSMALQLVQAPTRFLSCVGLCAFPALALCIPSAKEPRTQSFSRLIPIAMVVTLVVGSMLLITRLFNEGSRLSVDVTDWRTRPIELRAFQPANVPNGWRSWLASGGFQAECASRNVSCNEVVLNSRGGAWTVVSPAPGGLRLPMFWHPALNIYTDGKPTSSARDSETGLLALTVAPGRTAIEVRWATQTSETLGACLSVSSILLAIALIELARAAPSSGPTVRCR